MRTVQSPSFPDVLVREDGVLTGKRGGILQQQPDKQGYLGICRRIDGRPARVQTHTIVCEAFHGPRPDGLLVRHLNGDNTDNRAENLAWGTALENHQDAVRHGTVVLKLTEDQVREIRELAAERVVPQTVIASDYGISQQHVSAIHRREHWAWVPDAALETTAA